MNHPSSSDQPATTGGLSRRSLLHTGAALAGAAVFASHASAVEQPATSSQQVREKVTASKIRQSVMGWCFKPMKEADLIDACAATGLQAMEGMPRSAYPAIKKKGMQISLVGSHGFSKGFCDRENHADCLKAIREAIDVAVEFGSPSVITFTGMRKKGLTDDQMTRNCIEGWKQATAYAEEKKINLCLEHLNSRDDTHPMKGHPGYFGDDVDHCADMIKKVDSPRMKLLFDVYHVQIMNGDVIRRIRQYKDIIGHYHTAGNPGRGELDDTQEINYPPIMRTILETGYQGYVAQEFIPTWKDKVKALQHAAVLCAV